MRFSQDIFRSLFQPTWNMGGQILARAAQQWFSVHIPVLPLPQPRYVFGISSVGFLKCVDVEGPRPVSSLSLLINVLISSDLIPRISKQTKRQLDDDPIARVPRKYSKHEVANTYLCAYICMLAFGIL